MNVKNVKKNPEPTMKKIVFCKKLCSSFTKLFNSVLNKRFSPCLLA